MEAHIRTETRIMDMKGIMELRDVIPYLVYSSDGMGGNIKEEMNLHDIEKANQTWNAQDMAYGLNYICNLRKSNFPFIYNVYGKDDIKDYPEKENVKLFYYPAESRKFVILAAGGAYGAVCSLPESFPVAAELNRLGLTVFCLNYRVGAPALFPKPMEDLAAAYKYISENAELFQVDPKHYAVGGFSAGGHLAAEWGTNNMGAKKYASPAPELLLLDYPLVDLWDTLSLFPEPIREMVIKGYFGEGDAKKVCKQYEIISNMDQNYPPVYLVQAANDTTVPVSNSRNMDDKLKQLGIAHRYECVASGGHGFGLGTNTPAKGWVERAVTFWNELYQ